MSAPNSTTRNKHSRFAKPSIDITKEEFSRISAALKQEEFRKLFLDYCEEIQDPENRRLYEEEIKQLEAERGVDVRFINPEPGFVVKTSVDGVLKCFVNIAKCSEIAKPKSAITVNSKNNDRGVTWSIPMAQAPPRDDLDANNKRCCVYDVVFHPDALHLAKRNPHFRKCLIDTALDAVEREYKVNLDRANLKFPKIDFKGIARPTVIRKLAKDPPPEANEPHPLDNIYPERPTAKSGIPKTLPLKTKIPPKPEYAEPKYILKHRRGIDLTEYTEELDAKLNVTVPRELVVEIELPLLSSAAECQLDVTEKSVFLLSDRAGAKYRLQVTLPYTVNEKDGAARFDTNTRRLSITLPVVQPSLEQQRNMHNTVMHFTREDSGVESDVRDESSADHSPSESPIQEVEQNFAEDEEENETEHEHDPEELVEEEQELTLKNATENDESETSLVESDGHFLKDNVLYKFPERFDCNVLDNVMSVVLHVRNVQPKSIAKLQKPQSAHVHFTSIGSGYYPNHYAFYMQLPIDSNLKITSVEAEAWENNIVVNLHLNKSGESLHVYLAGLDSTDLKVCSIRSQFQIPYNRPHPRNSAYGVPAGPLESNLDIIVERKKLENIIEIEVTPRRDDETHSSTCCANTTTTEDDDETHPMVLGAGAGGDVHSAQQQQQKKLNRRQRKRNKKQRSLSESAFDDIKNAIQQLEAKEDEASKKKISIGEVEIMETTAATMMKTAMAQRKPRSLSECRDTDARSLDGNSLPFKGILKHYSRYGQTIQRPSISDSCSSSIEEYSSFSNFINSGGSTMSLQFSKSFSDIPEENVLSESCKKTVRFNDTIQKQIFRLDSSILGQRKKNQKRRDRKQRALQRRLSEGDSADYEEDHKPLTIQKGSSGSSMPTETFTNDNNNTEKCTGENDRGNVNNNGNVTEKNETKGKSGRGKKKRQPVQNRSRSRESESSDVEANKAAMMFEIDLE